MARLRRSGWILAAAVAVLTSHASAQTPTPAPGQYKFQLQVQFNPKDRKPVAFELVKNHIVFKVRVEGRDVWALLDNGADRTAIDSAFAKSCGLKVGAPGGWMQTPNGKIPAAPVAGVHVEIPGQASFVDTLPAFDFAAISKGEGRPISLVVGREFFLGMAVVIKSSDKTVEFWPSTALKLPPPAPHLAIPTDAQELVLKNDVPQIDIQVRGKPAIVGIDLGEDDAISLSDSAWSRLGLNNLATVDSTSMAIDGQRVPTKITVVGDVSIGPIANQVLAIADQPQPSSDGDGRVGMGFFSHYDFVVDLAARRIWFLTPPTPPSIPVQVRGRSPTDV